MKISLQFTESKEGEIKTDEYDLTNGQEIGILILFFGNGCAKEARVTGDSPDAIRAFVALINKGGYYMSSIMPQESRLYCSGDASFPEDLPFIFVNPMTTAGEHVEIGNVHDPKPDIASGTKYMMLFCGGIIGVIVARLVLTGQPETWRLIGTLLGFPIGAVFVYHMARLNHWCRSG